ncbi:MAG: DUF4126 domain-containing protein [Corynebacteriales bacterium]|nr:DUF4126 domain-containing protein [Mycobacteriales bacterium]
MLEFLTGSGLASAAGLNAYLPLLIVGLLDRYTDIIKLPHSWEWLSNPWVLGLLAGLLLIEIVADKVPVIDNVNDVIQTAIRPTSGGIVFGASAGAETTAINTPSDFFDDYAWVGVLSGVLIALAVHIAKSVLRPVINVMTVGVGAPIVSTIEDGVSAILSFVALLIPLLILFFFGGFIVLVIALLRKRKPPAQQIVYKM